MKFVASILTLFACLVCVPAKAQDNPPLDQADPIAVLQAVFDAARTGDLSHLPSLCDPNGENDGDTRDICTLTTDSDKLEEFKQWFSSARIEGEAQIKGDSAAIAFVFGPNGDRKEEMNLIKRADKWYLSSF